MIWLAPLFLAGLAAVALPLWLHRIAASNPDRRRFASLMFVDAGEPKKVLAKKLQYLLLLALRIAVLVLLVLAFAQPAVQRLDDTALMSSAQLHVIVIDSSASMGYGDRWSAAVHVATTVLDGLPSGDPAELVVAGRVPVIVTPSTTDLSAARDALASLSPGVFHVDYGRLMENLSGVIRAAELPVVIELVTDTQRSAMPIRLAELAPDPSAAIKIHRVASAPADNWAIVGVMRSASTGKLTVTVHSYASAPATKTVRLRLNGQTVGRQQVTIKPGRDARVEFGSLDLHPGDNRVVATLKPDDRLAIDDRYFSVVERPEPHRVLMVSGVGGADQAGLFVESALSTLSTLAINVQPVPASRLGSRDLESTGFVVVPDAGMLDAKAAAALSSYVMSGGSLLMALGQQSNDLRSVPVMGERIQASGASAGLNDYSRIESIDSSHPLVQGLSGLRSIRFFRHVAVVPQTKDQVVMAFGNGDPLLLERRFGAGRMLLLTSTMDRSWNDFPIQPAFVPFVARLADELLGMRDVEHKNELGKTISVEAMGLAAGQVFDPSGRKVLGLDRRSSGILIDQLGFYQAQGGGRTRLLAVNVDAAESKLKPVDQDLLDRWQALGSVQSRPAGTQAERSRAGPSEWIALAPWLLAALVVALGLEAWAGNWHLRIRRGAAGG